MNLNSWPRGQKSREVNELLGVAQPARSQGKRKPISVVTHPMSSVLSLAPGLCLSTSLQTVLESCGILERQRGEALASSMEEDSTCLRLLGSVRIRTKLKHHLFVCACDLCFSEH